MNRRPHDHDFERRMIERQLQGQLPNYVAWEESYAEVARRDWEREVYKQIDLEDTEESESSNEN